MLDKKQFDAEMDRIRQSQTDDLAKYLADYIRLNSQIRDMKLSRDMDEETINRLCAQSIQQTGRDIRQVADEMVRDVFQKSMVIQHPKFFSFVASAVSPYALAGAVLTDIYNPHGGGWIESPGACLIEEKLIRWMGSLAGYPEDTCGGIFLSGGSMSNMSALIAARDSRLADTEFSIGTAYISDQTHSSVAKGLRLIGIRNDNIIKIPTDDDFRMRTDLLEDAIRRDISNGKKPFAVIGTIATTNTGSIDPLVEIGSICKKYDLWFHVDGAYGGSILFSDIYRNLAKGVELSDSLSWDTHKWALQPYSCSSLIVKDKANLLRSFSEHPEYLEDIRTEDHNDPWDMGPELTRPHRALKLWFTLQAMGTDKLADIIDYSFYNAKLAERQLLSHPGWQIISKPMCGAITFRYAPAGYPEDQLDSLNSEISRRIIEDGFAYIVTTTLKGMRVLRMCMINGNTTTEDVISTVDYLDKIAKELVSGI